MIRKLIREFNKSKYLRVIKFNTDKSSEITYHKSKDYKPTFAINPDHVFIANGYRTIVISDTSAQTINPLDFKSKYDPIHFKTAIESKLITEAFTSTKSDKLDTTTILLILNLVIGIGIAYLIMKGQGMI